MKFSYSTIGDNTQENRDWLEKVGYKSLRFFQGKKYLYATTSRRANAKEVWNEPYYGTVDDVDFYVSCGFIPILGNSPLFKAVSAMREDSDYMQLFYIDVRCGIGGQMVGSEPKKRFWSICKDEKQKDQKKLKATISELIAHFKVEH